MKNIVKYAICYSIIYLSLLYSKFSLGFESTVLVGFSIIIALMMIHSFKNK